MSNWIEIVHQEYECNSCGFKILRLISCGGTNSHSKIPDECPSCSKGEFKYNQCVAEVLKPRAEGGIKHAGWFKKEHIEGLDMLTPLSEYRK